MSESGTYDHSEPLCCCIHSKAIINTNVLLQNPLCCYVISVYHLSVQFFTFLFPLNTEQKMSLLFCVLTLC